MPTRPKPACPVCRRLNCADESHKPRPFKTAAKALTRDRRPGWEQDRPRRRATVKAWLAANAVVGEDGKRYATCPDCGHVRTKFVADHHIPVGEGGGEGGELRVHCAYCSAKQGGQVAQRRQRRILKADTGGTSKD